MVYCFPWRASKLLKSQQDKFRDKKGWTEENVAGIIKKVETAWVATVFLFLNFVSKCVVNNKIEN